jgi:TolA-binding protein
MKSSLTEVQLRKLFYLGVITEKEYIRLVKKYKREGLSHGLKIEAIDLLERNLRQSETKIEKLKKKEKFLKKHLDELNRFQYLQLEKRGRKKAEDNLKRFFDIRNKQNKEFMDLKIELSQLDQGIKAQKRKNQSMEDQKKIADIRRKIC